MDTNAMRRGFGSAAGRAAQLSAYHKHLVQAANEIDRLRDALAAMEQMRVKGQPAAVPVACVAGYFAGRCVIEPINSAAVLPTGMALFNAHVPPSQEAKDAARYRWLRNEVENWYVGPAYSTYNDVVCDGEYSDFSAGGIALDSAIDAAMSAQKGGSA